MKKHLPIKNVLTGFLSRLMVSTVLLLGAVHTAYAQSGIKVTGKVSDSDGRPLVGATVVESGTTNGVSTDGKGNYTITVKSSSSVLEFEYLGYRPQKIHVGTKSVIDAILEFDAKAVEEVIVIGYGETTKTDLTGSVTNVKMADIKDAPVVSIDQALQGRIAGADIMTTSGDPTAGTSIRIRGSRSITASNEPLIVVDGIIDAIQDLSDINSADIESISVLKDASSTAIYGSRGSNGVIIVTTKKGNPTVSKPWITFKAEAGVSQLARRLDTMTASEFAQYYNEIIDSRNNYSNTASRYYTYKDPQSMGKGTNWIDEITHLAPYQNYNLSISGRTKTTNYYGSIGFSDVDGIILGSGYQRVTGRFTAGHMFNKWFKLNFNTAATYRNEDANKAAIGGTNWWNGATYLSPVLTPEDNYNPYYGSGSTFNNPVVCINMNTLRTERFSSSNTLTAEFTPVKGLKISSKNTVYLYQQHVFRYYPSTLPAKNEGEGGEVYRSEYETRTLSTDNTVTYKHDFNGGHHFDVMGGFLASHRLINDIDYNGKGYLVDDLKWNNLSGLLDKETIAPHSWNTTLVKMSVLGRINYNYKQRYYITLTGRADGSSNFAANHKWGFFPSAALKWMISNEPWLKNNRRVNELAIRFSAGRTGNDAIQAYRSLSALSSSASGYIFDGSQSTFYYPSRLESDDLTWEKTDLYNLGFDMAFFKNRLKITLEGYLSYTKDLLLTVQKAGQTGFQSHYENIGRTSNKGLELTVESRNIVGKNFSWTTLFTISHNSQKVEDIGSEDFVVAMSSPGNGSYMMYGYVAGRPLNSLWGFKYGGVWHSEEEIERNKVTRAYANPSTSVAPGLPRYIDVNHDGTLDNNDLVYLGNADPYVYGGLQNTFNIGRLRVGVYFSYSLGGKIYNYSELRMSGSYTTNQYRYMTNAWHPVRNPESNYPKAGAVEVHVPSNLQVHDASYLRLKTVSISYTFDLSKKTKALRDITLGLSGENLYLWSRYNGFDPDVSTESGESTLRRVDMGAYPRARTIIFSLQVRY